MHVTRNKFHRLSNAPTYKSLMLSEAEDTPITSEEPEKAPESEFRGIDKKKSELITKEIDRSILNAERRDQIFAHIELVCKLLGIDPSSEEAGLIQQSILGQVLLDYFRQGTLSTNYMNYTEFNNSELWKKYNEAHPDNPIKPHDEKHGSEEVANLLNQQLKAVQKFLSEHGSTWKNFVTKPNEYANKAKKRYFDIKKEYNKIKRQFDEMTYDLESISGNALIDEIVQNAKTELTEDDKNAIAFLDTVIKKLLAGKALGKTTAEKIGYLTNVISFDLMRINGVKFITSGISDDQKKLCPELVQNAQQIMAKIEELKKNKDISPEEREKHLQSLRYQSAETARGMIDAILKRPDLFTDKQKEMIQSVKVDISDPEAGRKKNISLTDLRNKLLIFPVNLRDVIYGDKVKSPRQFKQYDDWMNGYVKTLEELKKIFGAYSTESKTELTGRLNLARQQGDLQPILQELDKTGGPLKERLNNIISTAKAIDPTISMTKPSLQQIQKAYSTQLKKVSGELNNVRESMTVEYSSWKETRDPITALASMIVEELSDTNIESDREVAKRYELGTVALGKNTFNVTVIVSINDVVKVEVVSLKEGGKTGKTLADILPGSEDVPSMAEDIINGARMIICEAEGITPTAVKRKKFISVDDRPTVNGRKYPSWRTMIQSILSSSALREYDSKLRQDEKEKGLKAGSLQQLVQLRPYLVDTDLLSKILNDEAKGASNRDFFITAFEKFGGWFGTQGELIKKGKKIPATLPIVVPSKVKGEPGEKRRVNFKTYVDTLVSKLNAYTQAAYEAAGGLNIVDNVTSIADSLMDREERLDFERCRDDLYDLYEQYALDFITPTSPEDVDPFVERAKPATRKKNQFDADYEIIVYIPKSEFYSIEDNAQSLKTTKTDKDDVFKDIMSYALGYTSGIGSGSKVLETPVPKMSIEDLKEYVEEKGKFPNGIYNSGSTIFNGPRLFKLVKNALEGVSTQIPELNLRDRTYQQLSQDIVEYISKNLMKKDHKIVNLSDHTCVIKQSDPERGLIVSDALASTQMYQILSDKDSVIKIGGHDYRPMTDSDGKIQMSVDNGSLVLDRPPPPDAVRPGKTFSIIRLPEPTMLDVNGTYYRAYIMPSSDENLTIHRTSSVPFRWNKKNLQKYDRLYIERFAGKEGVTPEMLARISPEKRIETYNEYFKKELEDEKEVKHNMFIKVPKKLIEMRDIPGQNETDQDSQDRYERQFKQIAEQVKEQLADPKISGTISEVIKFNTFQSNDLVGHNINIKPVKTDTGVRTAYIETKIGQFDIEAFNPEDGTMRLLYVPKGDEKRQLQVGDRFVIHNVDYDINDTAMRSYQKESGISGEFYRSTKNRIKYGLPHSTTNLEPPWVRDDFVDYINRLHKEYIHQKSSLAGGPVADDFLTSRKNLIQERWIDFFGAAKKLGLKDEKRITKLFEMLVLAYDPAIVSAWGDPYIENREKWLKAVFGDNLERLDEICKSKEEKQLILKSTKDNLVDIIDKLAKIIKEKKYPGKKIETIEELLRVSFNFRKPQFYHRWLLPYMFNDDEEACHKWLQENLPSLLQEQDRNDDLYRAVLLTPERHEEERKQAERAQKIEDADLYKEIDIEQVIKMLKRKYTFVPSEDKSDEENEKDEDELENEYEELKNQAIKIWKSKDKEAKKRFYTLNLVMVESKNKDSMLTMFETITRISVSEPILCRALTYLETNDEKNMHKIYDTVLKHHKVYETLDENGRETMLGCLLENMIRGT